MSDYDVWIKKFIELYDSNATADVFERELGLSLRAINLHNKKISLYRRMINGEGIQEEAKEREVSKEVVELIEATKPKSEVSNLPDKKWCEIFLSLVNSGASLRAFKSKLGLKSKEDLDRHLENVSEYSRVIEKDKDEIVDIKIPEPTANLPHAEKVLIVMPCYNAQDTVEEAIISIMNQSYKNFHLICCDDFSTDNTYTVLEKLQKKYNFTLIRNSANLGTGRTINIATYWMTGLGVRDNPNKITDIYAIGWVSADNIYYGNYIWRHLDCLRAGNAISISSFDTIGDRNLKHHVNSKINLQRLSVCCLPPSFMYRKKLWDLAGPFHPYPGEDYYFFARCAALNAKFGVIRESLMSYRNHQNSVSGRLYRGIIKNTCSQDAQYIASLYAPPNGGEKSFD